MRQGSDPINSDPCSNIFIHQLGSVVDYFDRSCTAVVDGIHFPSDSTTVLGDMDTVAMEQMEIDTIVDTVDMSAATSEIKPAYSYVTDDGSLAFSASTRTSYHSKSTSKSLQKKVPTGNFNLVGRLHAKPPETNTPSSLNKKETFDDSNSIVTAPTDSFTSSKAGEPNPILQQNLQNTIIEEAEDEKAESASVSQEQRAASGPPPRPPSPATVPPKPMTPQDAAIAQGLDLCRRIRQSYQHPHASPIQQRSFESSSSFRANKELSPSFRQSLQELDAEDVEDEVDKSVPRTKMYGEKAALAAASVQQQQQENNNATPTFPPLPKRKSNISQKLKDMVPFGRKASF